MPSFSLDLSGLRKAIGLNGRRVAVPAPDAPPFGEWPEATRWAPWAWLFLGVAVAAPFPMFGFFLPERAVPIMWLLLGGAAVLMAHVARASWPLAALLAWAIVRAAMMAFPQRALQVLLLFALAGLLYAAARELSPPARRAVSWAFVVGLGWEFLVGLFNLFGTYPGMAWIDPAYFGRPMGFLTHVNYYGSFLALGLPLVWALIGLPAALAVYAMILATVSGGPVIAASAGVLFLVWPEFGRRTRFGVAAALGGAVATVMTLHEWRLSGRWQVWTANLPEFLRYPLIGQGLGSWRIWADHHNEKATLAKWAQAGLSAAQCNAPPPIPEACRPVVFATLQAHNEPYQLAFELGLIGVALAALWAWQAFHASARLLRVTPGVGAAQWWAPGRLPLERAWIGMLVVAGVNMLGSPVFHLPGQAALALFALGAVQAAVSEARGSSAPVGYAPEIGVTKKRASRRPAPAERT